MSPYNPPPTTHQRNTRQHHHQPKVFDSRVIHPLPAPVTGGEGGRGRLRKEPAPLGDSGLLDVHDVVVLDGVGEQPNAESRDGIGDHLVGDLPSRGFAVAA